MDQLDLIRQKVNIVDLIAESVTLKKAGRNFKALCPFHSEKTPSFIVSPERQIWKCFGCFPPGEFIKTPFGYHDIATIDKDHWVVSGNGNLKQVQRVTERQYEGELINLTLSKLRFPVRITSDHQVFVIRGAPYTQKKYKDFSKRYRKYLYFKKSNPERYFQKTNRYFPILEVTAGDLKQEDLLLYPVRRVVYDVPTINLYEYLDKRSRFGSKPKEISKKLSVTDKLLRLIGYYIAEGSNHRAYIRFSLGNKEKNFALEIKRLIKELFNLKAVIHLRKSTSKTGIEVIACHAHLASIFENLCGKHASHKHIPFIFQELPPSKQKILLNAIYRGDGTLFKANKSQNYHKSITTVSRILAEQLIDILLRLNLFPSLHIDKAKTDKLGVNHQTAYSVFWSEEAKQKYSLLYYQPDGTEYWILPIDKLTKESYTGPVYNLTVADDHSYVASSFAVSNCGKGGDAFTFVMELDRLEFPEALRILADLAGVKLERRPEESAAAKVKERLLAIHHLASEFYHYLLTRHRIGDRARLYLKERGITDATIKTFYLGFAPNAWDNLAKFLHKKGFSDKELSLAGVVLPGKRGVYDRFRARIMFPLKNYRGETIAFAGRVLDNPPAGAANDQHANATHQALLAGAKYINSPETPLYSKSEALYGLEVTKEAIRKMGSAVVVEGEFDLISSFQAGVANVIAIKGTALTEPQVNLLKRFTEKLVLSLDADTAGDAAARRGIEIADRAGLEIKVVQVPLGKDPDEAARENAALWKKAVENARPYYDFLLESAQKRYDGQTAYGKKKISDEVLPVVKKISNTIVQAHYLKKIAQVLDLTEEKVLEAMTKIRSDQSVTSAKPTTAPIKPHHQLLEEHLLSLVIQHPDVGQALKLMSDVFDPSDLLTLPAKKIFLQLVDYQSEQAEFDLDKFVKILPAELLSIFDEAYLKDASVLLDKDRLDKEILTTCQHLKKELARRRIKELTTKMAALGEKDEAELTNLQAQLKEETEKLHQLS